jgi:hypothetical protein
MPYQPQSTGKASAVGQQENDLHQTLLEFYEAQNSSVLLKYPLLPHRNFIMGHKNDQPENAVWANNLSGECSELLGFWTLSIVRNSK